MFSDKDYSYYDGIPKAFSALKDKKFEEWEIPPWNLLIYKEKLIGEGNFGKVYMANWNGTDVVAKVVNDNIPDNKKELFIKEFDLMTKVHHPNVVQLMGYVSAPKLIIVMEYLSNGELLKFVNNNKLNNLKKINICLDILRAMTYLHNRKPNFIIHRDIKPQNIVMTPSGRAKIADFGISRLFESYIDSKIENSINNSNKIASNSDLTTMVGSVRYMSPEVKHNKKYDHKIDIWSTGIIFAELFENKRYNSDFYWENKLCWNKTPTSIKRIITDHMIRDNPDDRYNAIELINLFEKEKNKYNNKCFHFF